MGLLFGRNEEPLDEAETKASVLLPSLSPESPPRQEPRPTRRASTILGRFITRTPSQSPKPEEKEETDKEESPPRELSIPPLSPLNLAGYHASTKHRLLDNELATNIRSLLPPRLQLYDDWTLVYSLEQHGISLQTLYRNCNPEHQLQQLKKTRVERGFGDSIVKGMVVGGADPFKPKRVQGYVMVIRDQKGAKFGCFVNEHLRPVETKRYYGNGQCFLWKTEMYDPHHLSHSNLADSTKHEKETRFKAFMYTGINPNLIYSNHNFIAIGSSNGQNGLWIDKSLYNGVSSSCETFGNEVLSETGAASKIGKFKIMGLEMWRVGDLE